MTNFEEKKTRIRMPLYKGEEAKLIFMWIKQGLITVNQFKELLQIVKENENDSRI